MNKMLDISSSIPSRIKVISKKMLEDVVFTFPLQVYEMEIKFLREEGEGTDSRKKFLENCKKSGTMPASSAILRHCYNEFYCPEGVKFQPYACEEFGEAISKMFQQPWKTNEVVFTSLSNRAFEDFRKKYLNEYLSMGYKLVSGKLVSDNPLYNLGASFDKSYVRIHRGTGATENDRKSISEWFQNLSLKYRPSQE